MKPLNGVMISGVQNPADNARQGTGSRGYKQRAHCITPMSRLSCLRSAKDRPRAPEGPEDMGRRSSAHTTRSRPEDSRVRVDDSRLKTRDPRSRSDASRTRLEDPRMRPRDHRPRAPDDFWGRMDEPRHRYRPEHGGASRHDYHRGAPPPQRGPRYVFCIMRRASRVTPLCECTLSFLERRIC